MTALRTSSAPGVGLPSKRAWHFAARMRCCAARGPAPHEINGLMVSRGQVGSSGLVARTRSTA